MSSRILIYRKDPPDNERSLFKCLQIEHFLMKNFQTPFGAEDLDRGSPNGLICIEEHNILFKCLQTENLSKNVFKKQKFNQKVLQKLIVHKRPARVFSFHRQHSGRFLLTKVLP